MASHLQHEQGGGRKERVCTAQGLRERLFRGAGRGGHDGWGQHGRSEWLHRAGPIQRTPAAEAEARDVTDRALHAVVQVPHLQAKSTQ